MGKDYETIQVLAIRRKTESSYLYAAQHKAGAPRDTIFPLNFHPAASFRMPIGTAASARAGDHGTIGEAVPTRIRAGPVRPAPVQSRAGREWHSRHTNQGKSCHRKAKKRFSGNCEGNLCLSKSNSQKGDYFAPPRPP